MTPSQHNNQININAYSCGRCVESSRAPRIVDRLPSAHDHRTVSLRRRSDLFASTSIICIPTFRRIILSYTYWNIYLRLLVYYLPRTIAQWTHQFSLQTFDTVEVATCVRLDWWCRWQCTVCWHLFYSALLFWNSICSPWMRCLHSWYTHWIK